jgi:segregation and condensation protein A
MMNSQLEGVSQQHGSAHEALPLAIVEGAPVTEWPRDLYIPPDALRVFLEAFEGPLDLLLYLIKRQNLDILDIPLARITHQYMTYIELMKELQIELAAEYLVMAAILAQIKSRMLLPRPDQHEDEEDPRAELVRRLEEYERYKKAGEDLDALPRQERDVHCIIIKFPNKRITKIQPVVTLDTLRQAFAEVLVRANMFPHLHVQRERLSVRERMAIVLDLLAVHQFIEFTQLFTVKEGRAGVIVAFLVILELLKESLIEIVQMEPAGPIYIKLKVAA